MYAVPCDTDCCEPDQFDCTQVMEQNNATEWEHLKVHSYCSLCINRTVMIGANDIESAVFFRYNEVTKGYLFKNLFAAICNILVSEHL